MRLRESTLISADASAVWPFLADPVLHANWNPKVVSIDRDRSGAVRSGERFEMLYQMSGRERQNRVEVAVAEPPHRVAFRHLTATRSTEEIVDESYEILPCAAGVKVVRTIDLSRAGISWPVRMLIWFFHRFGSHAEEPYLHRLKRLVEQPTAELADAQAVVECAPAERIPAPAATCRARPGGVTLDLDGESLAADASPAAYATGGPRRARSPRTRWCGWIVLAMGLPVAFFGVRNGLSSVSFLLGSARVEGTIVEMIESASGDSYQPVVEYTVGATKRRHTEQISTGLSPHRVGENVSVVYEIDRPEMARIDSFFDRWLMPTLIGGIGAAFTAVGVSILRRNCAAELP